MPRPKKLNGETVTESEDQVMPTAWCGPYRETREEYIKFLSREILIEMIKKEGKCLNDFPEISVSRATAMANLLNIK